MVKHIIFFTLKEDANKDAVITAAEKALMPLVGKIPGLIKMEVRRCFSGPDFVLYSELESREALAVYADHPTHIEANSHFFPWVQKAIVTVVGQDRVGIIAAVCAKLAEFNVNVLDISQTVMQGYFTMMMAAEVSGCNVPLAELAQRMDELGASMGLSIRVQREDIFQSMHRI